ncbi:MAG TPA: hypothetical protein VIF37_19895 [Methylobacter sp.]
MHIKKLSSTLLTVGFLTSVSDSVNAEDLGLFDRAASFALGVATKSTEKAVELESEKRADENPVRADAIRLKAKVGLGALQKADEKLFDAAGVNVDAFEDQLSLSKSPDLEVGIYGKMTDRSSLYLIPSQQWLVKNGININNAVAIRMPKNSAPQKAGDSDSQIQTVLIDDLKNLRTVLLNAGVDAGLVKTKIKEILDLCVVAY